MSEHLFFIYIYSSASRIAQVSHKGIINEIQKGRPTEVITHAMVLNESKLFLKNLSVISICPENHRPLAIHT